MAVTLKLSRQDAKYLVSILDAVSAATAAVEPRADLPAAFDRAAAHEAVTRKLRAEEVCSSEATAQALAADIVECIVPTLPLRKVDLHNVRGQRLMNRLPFGDWESSHRFVLRVGAVLQSGINIADERS